MTGFRSLRWRLTALIAAILVAAMGATFIAVYHGTGKRLRDQVDRELSVDARQLARSGVPPGAPSPAAVERAVRNYIGGQPFRASRRLLLVTLPGRPPITNEPGLVAGGSREAQALLGARPGYSTVTLAQAGSLRLYRERVMRGGRVVAEVGVGEPLAPVERAERGVATTFIVAGSVTLLIGLLAGYLVAARTARPLQRMARIAARVDGGDLSPRMPQGGSRDEVRALAESFDLMLDRLEDAFARQRSFASDASHELRTPLTVIRGQLEVLARQASPSVDDVRRVERLVRTEILRMERLVEDLLVLARADEREFLHPRPVDLRSFARELLDGARPTANRRFELGAMPDAVLDADPDRLAQALRNLLRNAIEYTGEGGLVRLSGSEAGDGRLRLAVEDDGPGIPPEHRERVFDRFHRTDSARSRASGGSGLGLAITRAVAEAHGGTIAAGESPEGGARIEMVLPGLRARSGPRAGGAERGPPGSGDGAAHEGAGEAPPTPRLPAR